MQCTYIHADHRHTETHRGRGSEKERNGHEKMSKYKEKVKKKTEKDTTSCLLNGYNFKKYSSTHWQSCRKIKH